MNLFKASQRAYRTARAHGFWTDVGDDWAEGDPWNNTDPHFINTKLVLIISEVVEAMEEHRAPDRSERYGAFADELADIVIRTADLAGHLGIDLEERVRDKMDVNDERPVMHGGKAF